MPAGRMMPPAPQGEQDEDCMCLPLVLMQLVMARPEVMPMMRSLQHSEVLDRKAGDGDKFPTQAVQVGKKTCKCSFAFVVDGKKVKASGSCDKKCSGAVKTMELEGENFSYTFGMTVKKGKVAIKGAKATALGGGESPTTGRPPGGGGGSGSGSGRPPIGGGGSGSGMPGGEMGSGCVCVTAPGGDGGHTMPTMTTPVTMPTGGSGSGSGETPVTMPTVATTGAPGGSGSGSGETPVTLPTVATTLAPGGNGTGTTNTTTTTTAPPPTTTNTTSGLRQQILADVFSVWQAFRDPLNGFWCDGLRFNYPEELVPCGPSNNFYSSAGTGMGLVSETIAVELGILTRQEATERVQLTIETVLSSWPRENDHGFLQHFTHRNYLPVAEYSTIDTTILALGALFAGNYFGGDVALLADSLVESVQWSDAIKNATRPRMYGSTKIKNAPEMKGNMWPYSEYYLLAYLANKTSAPGSKAARYFATYMGNDGEPPRDGVEPHPVPVNYFGHQLLSDGGHFPSSFIPQFNYYLSRGAQTNPFYVTLFQEWLLADKLFWEKTLTPDANIWGTPVAGRLWGAGAGPAPSGYGVEQINNSKDLVMSAAIMAGFLPAAGDEMREEINSQLEWLYTNDVCSYPVLQNGTTAKILWRCSARLADWRCPSVDSIDFSSFILGYSTNFLPADFFQIYSA